jgi:hypothetical protein
VSYVIAAQFQQDVDESFVFVVALEADDVRVLHAAVDADFALHLSLRQRVLRRCFVDYFAGVATV